MRWYPVLSTGLILTVACGAEPSPTEPGTTSVGTPTSAVLAANTWTQRDPHQLGPVIGVSFGVATNSAGQSVVYGFGGCDVVGSNGTHCTVSGIDIYNAVTGAWSHDHVFVGSVWKSNGVGTIGGKLYTTGGYGTHDPTEGMDRRLWAYDPVARRATQLANMPRFTAEGVTGVIDGKLYVLPGICDAIGWPSPGYCEREPIRRLYRYNPATNTWAARKSAPHFHRSGAAGVIGGKFYVVGGFNGTQPVADLDVYDPATDTWRTLAPIPRAGRAIGTALAGKLYAIVGTDAYVYNPGTNRWSPIAKPTWGHDGVVRVVINGTPRLLAIGGLHGVNQDQPNNTEVYTP